MSTLQRSSYSFRRQGSSGHIWDNRLEIPELRACGRADAAGVHVKNQQGRSDSQSTTSLNPTVPSPGVLLETRAHSSVVSPSPSSRSEHKPQRCAFIALFGRCGGSPTS